jgi:hypothetical protein
MAEITLEPTGSSDFEHCECCGERSRTVWGLARRDGNADAAYFVHWTLGKVADDGAHFDLILGRWGEGATPADRYAVSVEYRRTDRGPAFMVIDATTRPIARNELVTRALRRDEVVGTALAAHVFELVDAIWLTDRRISEVIGDGV